MALNETIIARMVLSALKSANPQADVSEDLTLEAVHASVGAIVREGNFPTEVFSPPNLTTTAGTSTLTPHSDMGVVHRVWLVETGKRTPLDPLTLDVLDDNYRYDGTTQTNAKPLRWAMNAGKIDLHPTPDQAYTIAYRGERKSSSLQNIPEQFRDVVIAGALSLYIPAYLPVFERGKYAVKRYWRAARGTPRTWSQSGQVTAHHNERFDQNVA